ncbi:hypothetical protein B0675_25705 [Streptomyces sp. M41(2017)]|nr:hypothetical protein B0675_25705 [Streptomyces sp. M41(2017)]
MAGGGLQVLLDPVGEYAGDGGAGAIGEASYQVAQDHSQDAAGAPWCGWWCGGHSGCGHGLSLAKRDWVGWPGGGTCDDSARFNVAVAAEFADDQALCGLELQRHKYGIAASASGSGLPLRCMVLLPGQTSSTASTLTVSAAVAPVSVSARSGTTRPEGKTTLTSKTAG